MKRSACSGLWALPTLRCGWCLSGTVLLGKEVVSNYCVLHFKYTNSAEYEDIIFQTPLPDLPKNKRDVPSFLKGKVYETLVSPVGAGKGFIVRHRFEDHSGYDLIMAPSKGKKDLIIFAETKNNKANGLVLLLDGTNDKSFVQMLHFVDGQAIGKWLSWGGKYNNYLLQITIKSPMDYFYHFIRMLNT